MRKTLALAAALSTVFASFSIPSVSMAQVYRDDPCKRSQNRAEARGTVAGGLIGALVGSQVAGRGDRTEGAIIGGAVGAGVGNRVGHSSVKCSAYPAGYAAHRGCRWVTDTDSRGRRRSFEVCRDRDGSWRRYRN